VSERLDAAASYGMTAGRTDAGKTWQTTNMRGSGRLPKRRQWLRGRWLYSWKVWRVQHSSIHTLAHTHTISTQFLSKLHPPPNNSHLPCSESKPSISNPLCIEYQNGCDNYTMGIRKISRHQQRLHQSH
jgi:hypothetical protein